MLANISNERQNQQVLVLSYLKVNSFRHNNLCSELKPVQNWIITIGYSTATERIKTQNQVNHIKLYCSGQLKTHDTARSTNKIRPGTLHRSNQPANRSQCWSVMIWTNSAYIFTDSFWKTFEFIFLILIQTLVFWFIIVLRKCTSFNLWL